MLRSHHAGDRLPTILLTGAGVLGAAAVLSAVLGDQPVQVGSVVALLGIMLACAAPLHARHRSLRGDLELHNRLMSRYCKFIDELHPMFQVTSWEQVAYVVNAQGDAREYATVRARVLRPDLQLFRLVFGCSWDQPARYRRKVKVSVRNLLVGNMIGTSLEITRSWISNGKFDLIIHIPTPPRTGSEIRFLVIMEWPKKCAPLMNNASSDDFAFRFIQQDVKHVSYRIVLPMGYDAYHEPIGFTEEESNFRTEQLIDKDGRRQYFFEAFNLPIQHRAGIKLEIKGRDTHALHNAAMSISPAQH